MRVGALLIFYFADEETVAQKGWLTGPGPERNLEASHPLLMGLDLLLTGTRQVLQAHLKTCPVLRTM